MAARPLSIVSVSELVPSVIGPLPGVSQPILLYGTALLNFTDPQAFVISSNGCSSTPIANVMTRTSYSFVNSTVILLTLVDQADTAASRYHLCLRLSASFSYFDTSVTLTVGL